MRISFNLIEKAIDLATRVFVTVRDSDKPTSEQSHLISLIDDVSRQIDSMVNSFAGEMRHQLEQQQLEKLSAQAKVVKLALEFGNPGMLGTALVSISEQIEYARVRLAEGKQEWFGPWMIAESVRIEALRIMADNPRAFEIVKRETQGFRIAILNHVGPLVIGTTDNPWHKIADFVEGRNEDVLLSLHEVKELQAAQADGADVPEKRKQPRAEKKTVLVPASGWPFPTNARP